MIIFDKNFNKNFNKKDFAFSLAESVISLVLLALVILLTMTSITRKKSNPDKITTISGMYACWLDRTENGTTKKEHLYEGQKNADDKLVAPSDSNSDCTFPMDRRVYKYYIYAVGTRRCNGLNCVNGQVDQKIEEAIGGINRDNMKLNITLGRLPKSDGSEDSKANGGITEVKRNNGAVVAIAKGGLRSNKSKLTPGNIKMCKYISGDHECKGTNEQVVCNVQNSEDDNRRDKGINPFKTSIILQCVKKEAGSDRVVTLDKSCQIDIEASDFAPNGRAYKGYCFDTNDVGSKKWDNNGTVVKVFEDDSALVAENKSAKDAEFVKHLKMMPSNKQNGLTDELLNDYQKDDKEKGGAVLIVW